MYYLDILDDEFIDEMNERDIKKELRAIRKSNAKKRTTERRLARAKHERAYRATIKAMTYVKQ
jgi:hypothetical protein